MQCACACVHVYVRGLHALEDLLGVDFRPCTRPQRADAPAFAHPLIITHVRAHMFNDTRCNTCVRACRWRTWCCALTATSCRCCTTCTTGVGFRPSARPQRASAAARLHPPIIANFHARKLNATRCNVCVRAYVRGLHALQDLFGVRFRVHTCVLSVNRVWHLCAHSLGRTQDA